MHAGDLAGAKQRPWAWLGRRVALAGNVFAALLALQGCWNHNLVATGAYADVNGCLCYWYNIPITGGFGCYYCLPDVIFPVSHPASCDLPSLCKILQGHGAKIYNCNATCGPTSHTSAASGTREPALSFEANEGQTDARVKFLARGRGSALFLTANEAVLTLQSPATSNRSGGTTHSRFERKPTVLRTHLIGGNPHAEVVGRDALPTKTNYYLGSNPARWHSGVPTYGGVEYRDVYPGVNQIYYGREGQLEYDLVVSPHADPTRIQLAFTGVRKMEQTKQGDLLLHTATGELRHHRPVAYQIVDGRRQEVEAKYIRKGKAAVGIQLARYDRDRTIVIDPVITWSEFLDLAGSEGTAIAVDGDGRAYITGRVLSAFFPTASPLQANSGGGEDAFVMKLNAGGSVPIYSTYLGGNGDDAGLAIAVDQQGNAVVGGRTTSSNFPTKNALQASNGGGQDGFVAKLDADGATLLYSTYLGGSGTDAVAGVAVDPVDAINPSSAVYVAGQTASTTFPTKNPVQATNAGGLDAFAAKLDPTQSGTASLLFSTYLGGSGKDLGAGVAVSQLGTVYVTGETSSANFPIKLNPLSRKSGTDAFVVALDPAKNGAAALTWATYLGGSADDSGMGIAATASVIGDIVAVGGRTSSADFPATSAFQSSRGGGQDGFVTTFAGVLSPQILYSTYLGGEGEDAVNGVAVNSVGKVYITGESASQSFPVKGAGGPANNGGRDAFAVKIDPAQVGAASLVYAAPIGGSNDDVGNGIAVDRTGAAYITGSTASLNFPMLPLSRFPSGPGDGVSVAFALRLGGSSQTGFRPVSAKIGTVEKRLANDVTAAARSLIKCDQNFAKKAFAGQAYDVDGCAAKATNSLVNKVDQILAKNPGCLQNTLSPEQIAALLQQGIARSGSFVYCSGSDPLDASGKVSGFMPPDAATAKIEDKFATQVSNLINAFAKCYEKQFTPADRAAFDKTACIGSATNSYTKAIAALGTVPTCVAAEAENIPIRLTQIFDNVGGDVFCSGDQEVPTFTPTVTPIVTPTPVATPTFTPIPAFCGDGVCNSGETVATCASDCKPLTCAGFVGCPPQVGCCTNNSQCLAAYGPSHAFCDGGCCM